MDWRERAALVAEARAEVHDYFKIPVMFSADGGVSWRPVFCRFHESVNPDGEQLGSGGAQITISSSNPQAVFRKADVLDLNSRGALVSVAEGKAYKIDRAAPADLYGYVVVSMAPAPLPKPPHAPYPLPDWSVS